ncbi:MAG: uroporphyrinogen decarboxylase family protein [Defluviitaleaceae bacterium]|nr:uroporphyrinogen decarboxylase family protein [Defluviitaleaceae bacterium]
MSYKNGMAAINLEMPDTVPRTEYSADFHWDLVNKVTGSFIDENSTGKERIAASSAFINAWDYGMVWNILIHNQIFGDKRTDMGHAVYGTGEGNEYRDTVFNLFEDPEDVYEYDMYEAYGHRDIATLTANFDAAYESELARGMDTVSMTGIYVSCMSGIIELLGWDILMAAAGIDPKAFGDFVNRYTDWIQQYFNALAACKSPVVMVHDDIVWGTGPFLHPDFYRKYIFPNYKKLLKPLHEAGKKILYTCDGDFTAFIDDVAACGVNGFVMEPLTDMAYIAEKYGKTHAFIGNADTNVLLRGSKADIEAEVKRCMDIGKKHPGFIMAVGNHIPANTPVDNALYYDEIYRKLARR